MAHQLSQNQVFSNELIRRFHEYVKPIRRNGQQSWRLEHIETKRKMIWKLKLTLSWVMGSEAMTLSENELLREIVTRYQRRNPVYVRSYFRTHVRDV